MPPSAHRTIDASVFLEVYKQGPDSQACEEFLDLDVSSDTILSDLTIGEVILNLKNARGDQIVEDAVSDFLSRLGDYQLVPLAPDCFSLPGTEDFKDIRGVQDKDRLLVAYAITNGLTQLTTLDRGLIAEQAVVDAICKQRGIAPVRMEWPQSAKTGRR